MIPTVVSAADMYIRNPKVNLEFWGHLLNKIAGVEPVNAEEEIIYRKKEVTIPGLPNPVGFYWYVCQNEPCTHKEDETGRTILYEEKPFDYLEGDQRLRVIEITGKENLTEVNLRKELIGELTVSGLDVTIDSVGEYSLTPQHILGDVTLKIPTSLKAADISSSARASEQFLRSTVGEIKKDLDELLETYGPFSEILSSLIPPPEDRSRSRKSNIYGFTKDFSGIDCSFSGHDDFIFIRTSDSSRSHLEEEVDDPKVLEHLSLPFEIHRRACLWALKQIGVEGIE